MLAFGARLRAAMDKHGPLCAGIDPHPSLLRDWGLADDALFIVTGAEVADIRWLRLCVSILSGRGLTVIPCCGC